MNISGDLCALCAADSEAAGGKKRAPGIRDVKIGEYRRFCLRNAPGI